MDLQSDGAKRLILVEDDDAYRYLLVRAMRARGLEVLDFRLALEALGHIDGDPTIRLAVLDIRMPPNTLTGLALARMMRFRNSGARVILMTGMADYLDIPEAEPFGEILLKTADAAAMAALIHARLELSTTQP